MEVSHRMLLPGEAAFTWDPFLLHHMLQAALFVHFIRDDYIDHAGAVTGIVMSTHNHASKG